MKNSGFNSPQIQVVPEVVDTELFNPFDPDVMRLNYNGICSFDALSPPTALAPTLTGLESQSINPEGQNRGGELKDKILTKTDESCSSRSDPLQNRAFEFLSIFKWEYRKGWDILLKSYWSAFNSADRVVLRLRTYLPSTESGSRNITLLIENFAANTFGKSLTELARVEWETGVRNFSYIPAEALKSDDQLRTTLHTKQDATVENYIPDLKLDRALTRPEMRSLLASADAFVLPTRAEGWGLPIAEAMAMALPVIVSNCSGPMQYANNENAYLIPVLPGYDNIGFARIDGDTLTTLLKQVYDEYRNSKNEYSSPETETGFCMKPCWRPTEKGIAARKSMIELSPDRIVKMMISRLQVNANLRGWDVL